MTIPATEIDRPFYESEEALLGGLLRQEENACTCLVKRFSALVYARALRMLDDADEAEGIVQQTFLKACQKIETFDGRSSLGTWLYRIVTNESLMNLRRRHIQVLSLDQMQETPRDRMCPHRLWAPDPSQAVLHGELQEHLKHALITLPESLRQVFVLRELHGMSTSETASILKLKENAVKVRLHRARMRLRELLGSYLNA